MKDFPMQHVFKGIQGIQARAMFGGYGLYQGGVIFGMIAHDQIYFKVGDDNISDYQAAESHPFTYVSASGKPVSMSYWSVPPSVLKNRAELLSWIQKSVRISSRKSTKKRLPKAKQPKHSIEALHL